jgi:peroxiredoxin
MAQLEPYKEEIGRIGSLAYIAAQKRGGIGDPVSWIASNPQPFPYLLDEDRTVTKQYGVYVALNYESINIARPASFVVGWNGLLDFVFVGSNQHDRADVQELLKAFASAQ